jgi:diacylglycerol O-acyltransferase
MAQYVFESRPNRRDEHYYYVGRHPAVNIGMGVLKIGRGTPPSAASWDEPDSAAQQIVRFRQRLRRAALDLAPPVWEEVPGFLPSRHVRHVRLSEGASLRDLTRAVDTVQNEPFAADRPPWRTVYFTGLADGRFASLMMLHHVFSDGAAIAAIFSKLLMSDLEADGGGPVLELLAGPPAGGRLREAVRHLRRNAPAAATSLVAVLRSAAHGRTNRAAVREQLSALLRDRRVVPCSRTRVSCAFWIAADRWEAAAADRKGTANDLFVALVTEVTARLLMRAGARTEETIVAMSVAGRADADVQEGGNVARAVHVRSPTTADPYDLPVMHERIKRALRESGKTTAGAPSVDPILRLLPGRLQAAAMLRQYSREHAVASNLVLPVEMSLRGAPVERIFTLAPAIGNPISFTMATYRGAVHLYANIDAAALDADAAYEAIGGELAMLCGIGGGELGSGDDAGRGMSAG